MLTAPKGKEELIMYLAAAKEAISAVLMTERDGKQMPIYFVSRALQGPEVNYTPMEKLILALVSASKRLKRYFQAHTIVVITDQPIKQMLSNPEVTGRLLKWRFELEEHDIHYRPRTSVKGQILADFIVERPEDDTLDTPMEDREELSDPWVLFTDGSSCIDGSGAGLIITNPEGMEFTYALRFRFNATNNEAKYEALIAGLRIAGQMGIQNLQANVDSKLVANQEKSIDEKEVLAVVEEEGHTWMTPVYEYLTEEILPEEKRKARVVRRKAGSMHSEPRSAVAKALRSGYYWPTMHMDARNLIRKCCDCQSGKVKFLIVVMDYFTKRIKAKPVVTITGTQVKKFVWKNVVCRFGLPGEIIFDNEKQFKDNPFKDWCEKLIIRHCFASVKHPQANGLVERANRSLGEGIKARLGKKTKNWVEEISHVLWAHRTMNKSSNGETPFSLTYGAEAIIPVEIGMPTLRTAEIDMIKNNEALGIDLDLLEEKREQAAIQEARSKAKM
ncbi:reverse transcriptase domain-containing protein [Tanacetum coccineum]|uniref:Reverse transcriptase domain-containing protein n=1 Tax=Tanacetum coccineum TaxID=301880 RepID=A0ABQ5I2T6_9ASTR